MIQMDAGNQWHITRPLLVVAALFFVLYRAVQGDPKDLVLWYQTFSLGSFIVAAVIVTFADLSGGYALLLFVPFGIFAILAGYFGLLNWRRRRKRTG